MRFLRYAWRWLIQPSDKNFFNSFVFFIFVVFQILDGVFTYVGINIFSIEIEGNFLIKLIISLMGVGWGLIVPKLVASGLGAFLYYHNLHNLITILTVVYMVFAILRWVHIFLTL